MALSDGMENTSKQGEAQKMPVARDGKADLISQANKHRTFHRYMDLPFKIRKQIRAEAIKATRSNFWLPKSKYPCYPLASVSKEWQEDVERELFSEIHIDPLNDGEVLSFREHFADKRKQFLTRLHIAFDDTANNGRWQPHMKLLPNWEKIGQFFH